MILYRRRREFRLVCETENYSTVEADSVTRPRLFFVPMPILSLSRKDFSRVLESRDQDLS